MIRAIANSLVPIFVVMALGYFAGRIRDLNNKNVADLNALVMDFALPASLLVATASTPSALLRTQGSFLLVLSVPMLLLLGFSYWMQRRFFRADSGEAAMQALTVALPNYAAIGLTLVQAIFGATRTIYVALSIAAGSIELSPPTLVVLELEKTAGAEASSHAKPTSGSRAGEVLRAIGHSLLKPVVICPIIGIALSLSRIPLPGLVATSLQVIGVSAGGVALFLTGLILSSQKLLLTPNVLISVGLRNIVHPLFTYGLVLLFKIPEPSARAVILLTALPSGFFGVLFGLRYGKEPSIAGSTLIVSTLLSVVTLTVGIIVTGTH